MTVTTPAATRSPDPYTTLPDATPPATAPNTDRREPERVVRRDMGDSSTRYIQGITVLMTDSRYLNALPLKTSATIPQPGDSLPARPPSDSDRLLGRHRLNEPRRRPRSPALARARRGRRGPSSCAARCPRSAESPSSTCHVRAEGLASRARPGRSIPAGISVLFPGLVDVGDAVAVSVEGLLLDDPAVVAVPCREHDRRDPRGQ